jgi:hypothetical protein
MSGRPARRLASIAASGAGVTAAVLTLGSAQPARAAAGEAAPHWAIVTQVAPSYFHAGDSGDYYEVIALNDGGRATSGTITVTDTLPGGVTATAVTASAEQAEEGKAGGGQALTCTSPPAAGTVACSGAGNVPTGMLVVMRIDVHVPVSAAGPLLNTARIEGGGAAAAASDISTPVVAPAQAVPYGLTAASDLVNADGSIDTQAGSHPFSFTAMLAFDVGSTTGPSAECESGVALLPGCAEPTAEARDLQVALPAGMVGNPSALPRCTGADFHRNSFRGCPADTQVGGIYLFFYDTTHLQYAPLYNVEPPAGQPAELGFSVGLFAHIAMYFHLRADGDYGLTAEVSDISEQAPIRAAALTIWGVPEAAAHDEMRTSQQDTCDPVKGCPSDAPARPFLTLPSSCTAGPLAVAFASDSWQQPEPATATVASSPMPAMTGCGSLSLNAALDVGVTSAQAGAPAGYTVGVHTPPNEDPAGLATPDVRDVEVTLPPGTVVSASAANGLQACGDARFGLASKSRRPCSTDLSAAASTWGSPNARPAARRPREPGRCCGCSCRPVATVCWSSSPAGCASTRPPAGSRRASPATPSSRSATSS